MPFAVDFTPPQIAAMVAIAFLGLLVGALLNQRLTRQRWEQLKQQYEAETTQTIIEQQRLVSQIQDVLDDKVDNLNHLQSKLESYISQLARAQAQVERIPHLEQQLEDSNRKVLESQLNLSKSNAMQQTIMAKATAEHQALEDKIRLLETAEERLKIQFENLIFLA